VAGIWVPTFAAVLSPRTRRDYAQLYERHLSRSFGSIALRDLTPELLARWQAISSAPASARREFARRWRYSATSFSERLTRSGCSATPRGWYGRPRARSARRCARRRRSRRSVEHCWIDPQPTTVAAAKAAQRARGARVVAPRGTAQRRQRDALLVSLMGYAGLRPGEALAPVGATWATRASISSAPCRSGGSRRRRPEPPGACGCSRRPQRISASSGWLRAGRRPVPCSSQAPTAGYGPRRRGVTGASVNGVARSRPPG
jgi:hypothetical protein